MTREQAADCCDCTDERYCDYCRLRDAAPDMLRALRHVENHLGIGEPLRSEIKSAIARATGEK